MVEKFTIEKLLKCKKELEEADSKIPRVYIDGVQYIFLKKEERKK